MKYIVYEEIPNLRIIKYKRQKESLYELVAVNDKLLHRFVFW